MVYGFWNQILMVYGYQLSPKNLWFMVFRHKSMEKRHCFILSSIETTNFLRAPRESPPRYIFSYNFGSLQFSQKLSSHSDYLSPLIIFSLPAPPPHSGSLSHLITFHSSSTYPLITFWPPSPLITFWLPILSSHSILNPRLLSSHSILAPRLLSSHSGSVSSDHILAPLLFLSNSGSQSNSPDMINFANLIIWGRSYLFHEDSIFQLFLHLIRNFGNTP